MNEKSATSIAKANILLSLQFLSDFGDQITSALLALCLLDISKSTSQIGFVYFITTAGYVVFTLIGGVLGDRLSRKNILFVADFSRAIAVFLLIFSVQQKSILLIYIVSFILSALGSIHRPVRLTIWTESIPDSRLERYNSFSEASIQISSIVGPLIASFFVVHSLTNVGFTIDAMTFFICAIAFTYIVSSKKIAPDAPNKNRSIFIGFKLITERQDIFKYVSYDALQMIGFGAFNATFLILAQRDFGWDKATYSYHLAIVAGFTTLCALWGSTKFVSKINPITKLVACAVISGATLWAALAVKSFPLSSILVGICDGLTVFTMAVTRTKVQLIAKEIYPDFITSVIAARFIVIKVATLLGTSACIIIDDFISLEMTLILLISPIAISFLPLIMDAKRITSPLAPNREI